MLDAQSQIGYYMEGDFREEAVSDLVPRGSTTGEKRIITFLAILREVPI
jgi:hypothetical protein